jgi:thiosulfate/3-mercaptopyruvate sulfurtransferase
MLNAIGHEGGVSLLDGGYSVWTDGDGATECSPVKDRSARYDPELNTNVLATRADVANRIHEDGVDVQLVDNRSSKDYYGLDDDDRVTRHGHITGSINVDFRQNLHDDGGARLRSPDDLKRLWLDDAGLNPDEETITSCTTAVRGSVGWFILRQLGWSSCRNYEGSWHDCGTLSETNGYYYTSSSATSERVLFWTR